MHTDTLDRCNRACPNRYTLKSWTRALQRDLAFLRRLSSFDNIPKSEVSFDALDNFIIIRIYTMYLHYIIRSRRAHSVAHQLINQTKVEKNMCVWTRHYFFASLLSSTCPKGGSSLQYCQLTLPPLNKLISYAAQSKWNTVNRVVCTFIIVNSASTTVLMNSFVCVPLVCLNFLLATTKNCPYVPRTYMHTYVLPDGVAATTRSWISSLLPSNLSLTALLACIRFCHSARMLNGVRSKYNSLS